MHRRAATLTEHLMTPVLKTPNWCPHPRCSAIRRPTRSQVAGRMKSRRVKTCSSGSSSKRYGRAEPGCTSARQFPEATCSYCDERYRLSAKRRMGNCGPCIHLKGIRERQHHAGILWKESIVDTYPCGVNNHRPRSVEH